MTRPVTPFILASFLLAVAMIWPRQSAAQPPDSLLSGILARDITPSAGRNHSLLHPGPLVPGDEISPRKKSVLLAASLSAVLPGSGQVYSEAPWWRAALYGTLEAAGWIAYGVYTNRGNRSSEEFIRYADSHWDVERYIEWIRNNYQKWNGEDVDKQAAADALAQIYRTTDPTLPAWERVNFEQLNRLERSVKGGFSHTLPLHGDQQYYEEIGKYVQYRSGWDDHTGSADSAIFDPSHVTARNQEYTLKREYANDLLTYADYAISLVILNHLASLLDAGLEARSYNIAIQPHLRQGYLDSGRGLYIETELRVTVQF